MKFLAIFFMLLAYCDCFLNRIFKKQSLKDVPRLPVVNSAAGETRSVLYHEQTMAIVDFNAWRQIIRCEVLDISQFKNQNQVYPKIPVGFNYMLGIMEQCDRLDYNNTYTLNKKRLVSVIHNLPLIVLHAPSNLRHAIYPGTKWCGMGDIAKSYHDLGRERDLDRCCRSHDLCPVKVEGKSRKFNIQNNSSITRSHCSCDTLFYNCLKNDDTLAAKHVGIQYFNLLHLECVEDDFQYQVKRFRKSPLHRF